MRSLLLMCAALTGFVAAGSPSARACDKPGAAPAPAQPGVPGAQPGFGPGAQPGFGPADPQKMHEMMQQQMAKMLGLKVRPAAVKWGGMVLEPADDALIDHLNLSAGKGMIVASVEADSAAAEAGLKKHDVVVKINGDAVPADARELIKSLGEDKSDPVDLVVVRKGKEQTLKGVKLPKAELSTPGMPRFPQPVGPGLLQPNPVGPGLPPPPALVPMPGQADLTGAKISFQREKEQFTAQYETDKLQIKVRGSISGMQGKVEEVTVQEGKDDAKKYQKVEDVPAAQQSVVMRLVQLANGNAGGLTPPALIPQPVAPPPPLAPNPPENK
jgi:membrane-associated protease RseP (regulator of RpoE activity)